MFPKQQPDIDLMDSTTSFGVSPGTFEVHWTCWQPSSSKFHTVRSWCISLQVICGRWWFLHKKTKKNKGHRIHTGPAPNCLVTFGLAPQALEETSSFVSSRCGCPELTAGTPQILRRSFKRNEQVRHVLSNQVIHKTASAVSTEHSQHTMSSSDPSVPV